MAQGGLRGGARRARDAAVIVVLLTIPVSQACQSSTAADQSNLSPTSWPNEPAGLNGLATLAGARDYDFVLQDVNNTYPTTSGWYNEYPDDYAAGQLALITDNTAPSPNGVVQVKYPIGFSGGAAPGGVEWNHPPVTEYYLGFFVKISKPYLGVSGGHNKLAYIYTGDKDLVFEFTPSTSSGDGNASAGPWHFFWAEYVSHNNAEFDTDGTTQVTGGIWYRVEILMSYSQGVVKWWVNGKLDGSIPCNFNAYANGPLHLTYFTPTYGGGGLPAKTEVDYIWYDHVHMSGRP